MIRRRTAGTGWAAIVALLGSGLATYAAEKSENLPVTAVTVYEDRALVTRAGDAAFGRGSSRVVLEGLPALLDEASLRASIEGAGAAKVVSVSTRTEERAEAPSAKIRSAQEAVEKLERELARMSADDDAYARESKSMTDLLEMARKAVSEQLTMGATDPAAVAKVLDFFTQRRDRIDAQRRDLAQGVGKKQEELRDARAELNKVQARHSTAVRTVLVDIEAAEAAHAHLSVSYIVRDCGWAPRYDARLVKGRLRVTYEGEVRQKTGEDWAGVKLALSTAHPALGAKRPDLLPVRMYSVEQGPVSKAVGAKYEEVQTTAETTAVPEGTPSEAEPSESTTVVASTGTSVAFLVPDKADIPADGRAHKVAITTFEDTSPKLAFETVPKMLRYVFLRCDTANFSAFPMLAGAVDIWRESGFIGTASTAFVAPQGRFDLSFGIDENLKVKRIVDTDRSKETSAGSRRERRTAFDIEVANYRPDAADVFVKEHIPVSDIEEVEVELAATTTPTTENDKAKGLLTWKLSLAPGEKKRVHLEYAVRMPKDFYWAE